MSAPPVNALSVDVEDWFQVSAFEHLIDRSTWDALECRVARNMRVLLDLFDRRGVKATFFTLGWIADRHPEVVAEAHAAGHEIASHGYAHRLVSSLTAEEFRADLARTRASLEAAAPCRVTGFRAPSFSFTRGTPWAFDVLRAEGYAFSSSVFPVRHDRYGIPDFPRVPVRLEDPQGRALWEFPMTTWHVLGRNLPASGGGWLRFLPPAVIHHAIRRVNSDGVPAILYLHPWEVDPEQPRVRGAGAATRFRHYVNLGKTLSRLDALLQTFPWAPVSDVLAALPATAAAVEAPAWARG
jgi:polysaccharide deacetylase family protein (PEP-CTERM system associated)